MEEMSLRETWTKCLKGIFDIFLEVLAENAPVSPVVEAELVEINNRHMERLATLCDDYEKRVKDAARKHLTKVKAANDAFTNKLITGLSFEDFEKFTEEGEQGKRFARQYILEQTSQHREAAHQEIARSATELDRSLEQLARESTSKAEAIIDESQAECNRLLLSVGLAELTFRDRDTKPN